MLQSQNGNVVFWYFVLGVVAFMKDFGCHPDVDCAVSGIG